MKKNGLSGVRESASLRMALAALFLFQNGAIRAQTPDASKPTTELEELKQRGVTMFMVSQD